MIKALLGFLFCFFCIPFLLQAKEIKILATTGMIADILKNIAPQNITITQMMGAGIDPHTYKPSAGDLKKIQTSTIIFYNGFHLETSLEKIFRKMRHSFAICEIIDNKKLIKGQYELVDPHIWMDVVLWQECVFNVNQILQKEFPDSKQQINTRYLIYNKSLNELNIWVEKKVAKLKPQQKILITAHDAFRYFGKGYNFEVRGIQGISTVSEAGIKDIKNLADFVVMQKIPAIFVETSVAQHNIIALREAVISRGWSVKIGPSLFSDSMGVVGSGKDNYLAMIKHNITAIVTSLKND